MTPMKIIILIIIVLLFVTAFYNGLIIRQYTVTTPKLAEYQSFRIVLITDLHSTIHGSEQSKIADRIRDQKPDMIALAGDIADDIQPIKGTIMLLEAIKDIAPVFYVTGNHEIWSRDVDNIKDIFRSYGVTVLENETVEVLIEDVPLIIGGAEDPDINRYERRSLAWKDEVIEAFSNLHKNEKFQLLLSHRPEQVDIYKQLSFDLVLSGHAHGGQVRIPFILNGLLAPNQGFLPKYAGGIYEHDNFTHIVSRGVSFNPRLPRIFNPPEIVVIDVIGECE
ncbi:MAG: metallophosphoesterase [Dethiosulfatibacter sp.]|nr:metallophosphoesterase [Dethiosulfatibacter sp.]